MALDQANLIYIENLLANDQLELATIYMSKAVADNKKAHEEEQRRMVEFTAKQQQESAAAVNQMEVQKLQMEAQIEAGLIEKKIQLEGAMKERLQAQKGAIEIEQIKMEIEGERVTGTDIKNPQV